MEKFLTALTEEAQLREDFLKQTTPDGAYMVAKPYIGNMSKDEFARQMIGIARAMDQLQSNELDEKELNAVSGGNWADFMAFVKRIPGVVDKVKPVIKEAQPLIGEFKTIFSIKGKK